MNINYKNIKIGDKIKILSRNELLASGLSEDNILLNYANQIFTIHKIINIDDELVSYKVKEKDILNDIELFDSDFIILKGD